jgi:hypothetical protein
MTNDYSNEFDDIFEEIFPIDSVEQYAQTGSTDEDYPTEDYTDEADEITPDQVNLNSFREKSTLCPTVFNLKTGDLKKVIRKRLIKIARDFVEDID